MPLLTTTIGSYPKPDYTPVPGWFAIGDRHRPHPTEAYSAFLGNMPEGAPAALDRATEEVVREQAAIGIDVPTDGEVRREHYIYYHLRHLQGFNFDRLSVKVMRGGAWQAEIPTVVGPLAAGPGFLVRDWRTAQGVTGRRVKITLPGPLTIMDSTADAHYGDERKLAFALADALNVEVRRLAEAGCRWIQLDEPVFARQPERALDYGMEALGRCFAGISAPVARAVHICCGYPRALDQEDYAKADRRAYSPWPMRSRTPPSTRSRSRMPIAPTTSGFSSVFARHGSSWGSSESPDPESSRSRRSVPGWRTRWNTSTRNA